MFFTPLVSIVPTEVAAAALVIVGALMMSQIRHIDLTDFSALFPVFVTVAVMPMTYSIANGIGAGFVSWVLVRAFSGRVREISPLLWIVTIGFVIYFVRGPIEALLPLTRRGRSLRRDPLLPPRPPPGNAGRRGLGTQRGSR